MRGTGAESLVVVMKSLSWRWSEGATSGGLVRVQLDCPGGDTDEDTTMCQPTGGSPDGSGMSREAHVPFYEGLGVQFPRPTHRAPQQAVGKMTDGPSKSAVRSWA